VIEPERIQALAAARITGLSLRTIQAHAPRIPGAAKLLGRWTFDPIRLRRWIADMEAASCRVTSTEGALSGGGVSKSPEPSIAEAYERAIGLRRRPGSKPGRRCSSEPPTSA
jgi:hypothetical protein